MTCPTLDELAAYQLHDLSAARTARVRRHVEGCAACRQALARLAQTSQMLAALPAPVMPADLWPGVAARLRRRSPWWQQWRRAAATAGIAAGVGLAVLFFRASPPTPLPVASPMTAHYIADHQFLSAQDPLADRASVGVALAAYRDGGHE